jgi:hypothetical protein
MDRADPRIAICRYFDGSDGGQTLVRHRIEIRGSGASE